MNDALRDYVRSRGMMQCKPASASFCFAVCGWDDCCSRIRGTDRAGSLRGNFDTC